MAFRAESCPNCIDRDWRTSDLGDVGTWVLVSTTLADQQITTSEDACLPDRLVRGPFTAYCQAKVIEEHTLERTGELDYAELERDDPLRETALTSSFLQPSLFISIVAFGLASNGCGSRRTVCPDRPRHQGRREADCLGSEDARPV